MKKKNKLVGKMPTWSTRGVTLRDTVGKYLMPGEQKKQANPINVFINQTQTAVNQGFILAEAPSARFIFNLKDKKSPQIAAYALAFLKNKGVSVLTTASYEGVYWAMIYRQGSIEDLIKAQKKAQDTAELTWVDKFKEQYEHLDEANEKLIGEATELQKKSNLIGKKAEEQLTRQEKVFEGQIGRQAGKLESRIMSQATEFEKQTKGQEEEFKSQIGNQADELESRITSQATEFEKQIKGQAGKFESQIGRQADELESRITSQATEFEKQIKGQAGKFESQIGRQADELESRITSQATEFEKQIKGQAEVFEGQKAKQEGKFEKQMTEQVSKLAKLFDNAVTELGVLKRFLKRTLAFKESAESWIAKSKLHRRRAWLWALITSIIVIITAGLSFLAIERFFPPEDGEKLPSEILFDEIKKFISPADEEKSIGAIISGAIISGAIAATTPEPGGSVLCKTAPCEAEHCEAAHYETGSCEAATCEATTCEAATCEATTCEAATCEAVTCEAVTCEAATCEAATSEAATSEAATSEAVASATASHTHKTGSGTSFKDTELRYYTRWASVLLLISSFGIWLIRLSAKIFVINLDSKVDAEERVTMFETFLALQSSEDKDGDKDGLTPDERLIFFEALFRPSPVGFIKDVGTITAFDTLVKSIKRS